MKPSDVYIEHLAREVLARPEFHAQSKSLLQRALGNIGSWIARLFGHLAHLVSAGGGGGISLALSLAVVAVVAAVIAFVAWHLFRHRRPSTPTGPRVRGVPEPALPGSAEWLREASAAEDASDYGEVLRCLYRAALSTLAEARLVDEVAGRTAGEYRGMVLRCIPDGYAEFTAISDAFEGAWYAGDLAGPQDARSTRQHFSSLRSAAERGSRL